MSLLFFKQKQTKKAAAAKKAAASPSKTGIAPPIPNATTGFISAFPAFANVLPMQPAVELGNVPSPGEMKAAIVAAKTPPLELIGEPMQYSSSAQSAPLGPSPYDVPLPPGWDTGEESTLFGLPPLVVIGAAGLVLFLVLRR